MAVLSYASRIFGFGKAANPSDQLQVSEMRVYPVKSCRGFSVDQWNYTTEGLEYDRQWMVVSESRHRFVTAREFPRMLLISTAIDLDGPAPTLTVTIPDTPHPRSYTIPVAPAPDAPYSGDFSIWNSPPCDGYDVGTDALNDALSAYLGFPALLILKGPEPRTSGQNHAVEALDLPLLYDVEDERTLPPTGTAGKQSATRWADGYPFLLTTRESESEVKRMVEDPCNATSVKGYDAAKWGFGGSRILDTTKRFRSNVILAGAYRAWEEDGWLEVKVGNQQEERWSTLFVASRCGRCMVPNTDPETAERDAVVPFNVMKSTRAVGETTSMGPCFGVNALPETSSGTISVGDSLYVIRRCVQDSHGVWQRPEDDRAVAEKLRKKQEAVW